VDLFAGPGRARIGSTGSIIDGSPMIAFRQPVPFTDLIVCDVEPENIEALKRRTQGYAGQVHSLEGDCNALVDEIARRIPQFGLNVALIDPYNFRPLVFETIARLARFPRMDLILHYPVGELRRNLEINPDTYGDALDRALATPKWRDRMRSTKDVVRGFIDTYREQLEPFGYTQERTATAVIRNDQNVPMYHLVYASKHTRGDKIWSSVVRNEASGQKTIF
jgi:three-Cys-motif partner protein